MKIRSLFALGVAFACAVVSFAETVVNLSTGENELTAALNTSGTRLVAVEGSILKLTGAATSGTYTIKCAITAQAGEFVIDATGVTDLTELRMTANLGSDGKGSVTIKGVDRLTYGTSSNPDRRYNAAWGDVAAIDTGLSFVDGEGVPYGSPSVTFVNGVLIAQKPNYAYAIADGAYVFPYAEGALEALETDDALVLGAYDLALVCVGGVTGEKTIKVGSGRYLYFKPFTLSPPGYTWGGATGKTFANDIELAAGSTLLAGERNSNTLKGKISGAGTIDVAYSDGLTLDGDLAEFTGQIKLNWHETVANQNYVRFRTGAGLGEGASVTATSTTHPSTIICEPEGPTFALRDVTASAPDDPNVVIQAKAGVTVRVGTFTGSVRLAGGGCVDFDRLADNAKVFVPGGTKVIVRAKARTAQVIFEEGPAGNRNWMLGGPSDGTACPVFIRKPQDGQPFALAFGGKLEVLNNSLSGCTELSIEKDAVVSLPVDPSDAVKVRNYGGTLTVQGPDMSWRGKVSLWVDATEDSSITLAKDFELIKGDRAAAFAGDEDLVGAWKDCRGLLNGGLAQIRFTTTTDTYFSKKLYPRYHATGGPNDLPYMENWDEGKSRFYMVDPQTLKAKTLATRHILMVFGSQNGGGKAMIAETHGHYVRSQNAKTVPIVSSTSEFEYVAATNGVTGIDPRKTNPTGDWQILSLAVKDTVSDIVALGGTTSAGDGSDNGGQCYAEVLLFDEVPSEAELAAAEQYLSEKWRLPVQCRPYEDKPLQIELQGGEGSYAFTSDSELSGHFKGTLDLNGRRVSLTAGALPYLAADIPAEGRSLWVDPSLEGSIVFGGDAEKPLQVWGALPRDNAGLVDTNKVPSVYLLGVSDPAGTDRRPWFSDEPRVPYGAAGWLDFSSRYYDGMNKVLLLAPTPINPATIKLEGGSGFTTIQTVRDIFLVLDSSMGGGSTYLTQANGKNGALQCRGSKPECAAPIWSASCGAAVREGETRLDGVVVDPDAGFTGKPEVLTLSATGNVEIKTLGYYEQDKSHYEVFAETLVYSTPLADGQRRGIEAYLMQKWLDKLPEGYADFRGATVTGSGTLVVSAPKHLPQIGGDFTGAVELGGFDAPFVLNGGTSAENAVSFDVCSPKLTDAVVDVRMLKRHAGAYLLASGVAEGSTVTLGSVEGIEAARVSVRVTGTAVYADVQPIGMVLIVK